MVCVASPKDLMALRAKTEAVTRRGNSTCRFGTQDCDTNSLQSPLPAGRLDGFQIRQTSQAHEQIP